MGKHLIGIEEMARKRYEQSASTDHVAMTTPACLAELTAEVAGFAKAPLSDGGLRLTVVNTPYGEVRIYTSRWVPKDKWYMMDGAVFDEWRKQMA